MDVIEKLWKEYKKNTQKIKARAISRSTVSQQSRTVQTFKKQGKEATEQAKSSTSEASEGLQQSVQGQFGKKVTEVFDKQKETLEGV